MEWLYIWIFFYAVLVVLNLLIARVFYLAKYERLEYLRVSLMVYYLSVGMAFLFLVIAGIFELNGSDIFGHDFPRGIIAIPMIITSGNLLAYLNRK